jgi:hypothetical protein
MTTASENTLQTPGPTVVGQDLEAAWFDLSTSGPGSASGSAVGSTGKPSVAAIVPATRAATNATSSPPVAKAASSGGYGY